MRSPARAARSRFGMAPLGKLPGPRHAFRLSASGQQVVSARKPPQPIAHRRPPPPVLGQKCPREGEENRAKQHRSLARRNPPATALRSSGTRVATMRSSADAQSPRSVQDHQREQRPERPTTRVDRTTKSRRPPERRQPPSPNGWDIGEPVRTPKAPRSADSPIQLQRSDHRLAISRTSKIAG